DGQVDARADIYAFGAVMFELFTGRRAWPGDSPIAVAAARLLQPPPDPLSVRPDMPAAYAQIVARCLARRPADRFASADAVGMALRMPSPFSVESGGGASPALYDMRTAPTIMDVVSLAAPSFELNVGASGRASAPYAPNPELPADPFELP